MTRDPIWTENALADLRRDFGDVYGGRTMSTRTDVPIIR